MLQYSILICDINCPTCGAEVESLASQVHFQWGKVGEVYSLGDPIRWLKDKQGDVAPPFTMIEKRYWILLKTLYWNNGDPTFANVAILDRCVQNTLARDWFCNSCKNQLEAILIKIEQGSITSARVLKIGETEQIFGTTSSPVDTWILESDGTFSPRYDWYDPPLITPDK